MLMDGGWMERLERTNTINNNVNNATDNTVSTFGNVIKFDICLQQTIFQLPKRWSSRRIPQPAGEHNLNIGNFNLRWDTEKYIAYTLYIKLGQSSVCCGRTPPFNFAIQTWKIIRRKIASDYMKLPWYPPLLC